MKPLIFAALLMAGGYTASYAQTDAKPAVKKEATVDQFFAVQINQLIRQVFNFSNSTTTGAVNPYLLSYSVNSKATGWGLRVGVGYNYASSSSNDGITSTDTKLNDLSFRMGADKIIQLSGKWSAGIGIDAVMNVNDDHTVNNVNSNFGGQSTDTKTTISSYGGGPMGWLRYHLTPRIMVGTEASFYYVTGSQKQTITIIDPFGGGANPPTTTSNKISQGTITEPVVIYLIVKF